MKKFISVLASVAVLASVLAACGNGANNTGNTAPVETSTPSESQTTSLSGTISTNGSTSMEKVISSLIEAFTEKNPDVTITYDATGSGTGITAAQEGTTDIGLSSRKLKDEETAAGLDGPSLPWMALPLSSTTTTLSLI